MEDLLKMVTELSATADKRNLAIDNPISFKKPDINGILYVVVVAKSEPSFITYPFNVTWVNLIEGHPDYNKVLRRTGKPSTAPYNNSWETLTTYLSIFDSPQFFDQTDTALFGEHKLALTVVPATINKSGTFLLNGVPPDVDDPIVVGSNDPRLTDARVPIAHEHPVVATTRISVGNGEYVSVGTTNVPQTGQMLFITGAGPSPDEYLGVWREVTHNDINFVGAGLTSLAIQGPTTVIQSELSQYSVLGTFDDASTHAVTGTWSIISGQEFATIDAQTGLLTAVNTVSGDNNVVIQVTYRQPGSAGPVVANYALVVSDGAAPPAVVNFQIINGASSINENASTTFEFLVTYDDTTTATITPSTFTSTDDAVVTANKDTGVAASVSDVNADSVITLTATHVDVDLVVHTDTHEITVVDTTAYLASVALAGPSSVDEGQTGIYTLTATYTDNSTQVVVPTTFTSSDEAVATIDAVTGVLTAANDIGISSPTTLSVDYTENGITKTASTIVNIIDTTLYPASVNIVGPATVNEDTTQQYTLQVTYTNSTTAIVTADSWTVSTGTDATIDSSGLLTSIEVGANSSVEITAEYTAESITVNDTQLVAITNVVPVLTGIAISGDTTVSGGQGGQYTVTATYDNGDTVDVTGTASFSVTPSTYAAITSAGVLSTTDPAANESFTINSNYTDNGVTKAGSLTITLESVSGNLVPKWGYGIGFELLANIDEAFLAPILTNDMPSNNDGEEFSINTGLNVGTNKYAYFAHPASIGEATFLNLVNNFQGGWDSILWDNASYDTDLGPAIIQIGGVDWQVYRIDYPDTYSETGFSVSYSNN